MVPLNLAGMGGKPNTAQLVVAEFGIEVRGVWRDDERVVIRR